MQISVDGTRISGSADLRLTIDGRKAQLVFMLDGRFQNDRFLRLDYTSSVAGETHFGTFILEMNPLGTRLTGQFLGYGAYTERLVGGKVTVEKQRIVAENVKRERA